jgi:citronellyl-CoA dehydrogenase
MTQFQNERMIAAYMAVGGMHSALQRTADYLRERRAFGAPLLSNQFIQFKLAELSAGVDLIRHYNYACAEAYMRGDDTTRFATIAKLKAGRLQREVADWCLQFHGGTGYMAETWVSRYLRDSRLMSIGGGADEIMLHVLAKLDGFTA